MVIKTLVDCTGSIILKWHIKAVLDTAAVNQSSTMLIPNLDSRSTISTKTMKTFKSV